ncbi:MAG: GTP pyrophosphokinase family protein [Sulfurimonas sp.]|uniref:GTP pyrophosphokinase n=1 Tax=Sulfurimonas sp. TaxID=2022749 RepID=UPI003D0C49D2
MNKAEIKTHYDELAPLYQRLGENIKNALIQFLEDLNIDYLDVEFRVKDFKSFYEKIERKNYKNPFEDIQDFCGLRIINYYPLDLDKITNFIKKEFNVSESIDKQDELDDDRFGYRSYHFIATLKEAWMSAPNYRGLAGLNFEIQARTILMHGWAAINHKLLYKHEEDIPKEFKRDLFRLSALIELADEQFERLRTERSAYIKETIIEKQDGTISVDTSKSLNIDSLQALLKSYFPNREGYDNISAILEKIRGCNLTLEEFNKKLEQTLPYLEKIEEEELGTSSGAEYSGGGIGMWNIHAIVVTVLDLTVDGFLEENGHPAEIYEISKKYKDQLNNS